MNNCPRCDGEVTHRRLIRSGSEYCNHSCHQAAQAALVAAFEWRRDDDLTPHLEAALDALDAAMAKPCKCSAGTWIATIKTICPAYKRAIRYGAARCATCEHDEACHQPAEASA